METCMYGSGAGTEKPTAERQKGTLYRAYTKEPSWQRLIQQRMQGNLSRHIEVISTSKSRLIEGNALLELNGEVKSLYADMGLNFSTELSNRLQTIQNASLSITVEFFPLHQSNEDESPTRIEQDSKENKTSFFKRLFK